MNQRPSNIELAKKFKTFRLSGQHEAAAEMITEDAYAIPPISMFGEMHGRDKIKQFWIDHYDENQEVTFETTVCNNGPLDANITFFIQNLAQTIAWNILSVECIETTGTIFCGAINITINDIFWLGTSRTSKNLQGLWF